MNNYSVWKPNSYQMINDNQNNQHRVHDYSAIVKSDLTLEEAKSLVEIELQKGNTLHIFQRMSDVQYNMVLNA